jgi:two-component system OmpR family sensor kinase
MTRPSLPSAPYSLRRRLLFWLFATITLGAIAQTGVSYRVALEEVDLLSDYHMEHMALALKSGLPPPVMPSELDSEDPEDGFDLTIQAWNNDGEQVLGGPAADRVPTHEALGFSTLKSEGRTYRIFAVQHLHGIIQVTNDMSSRNELARKLAWRTSTPVLLMAPLLLLGVWWLVSLSLHPIEQARAQVADRQPNDLSPLSSLRLPSELLPFVHEINSLFERIRSHLVNQQNFIADAAHELRSPLTALRLQVQGQQRAQTEEDRQLANRRLLAGIDRSTHLIEQMLVLARQEVPESSHIQPLVDLPQLIRLVIADVLPLAQSRHIDLGTDSLLPAVVQGHAESLRVLLRNLLDNAVKYTPEQGVVNISSHLRADKRLLLRVEDSGAGIAADDLPRVFDRFYRGQQQDTMGSGLGLSIVRAIADRHGIQIQLQNSQRLRGLQVDLLFPHAAGDAQSPDNHAP